jgi:hypothetical protein
MRSLRAPEPRMHTGADGRFRIQPVGRSRFARAALWNLLLRGGGGKEGSGCLLRLRGQIVTMAESGWEAAESPFGPAVKASAASASHPGAAPPSGRLGCRPGAAPCRRCGSHPGSCGGGARHHRLRGRGRISTVRSLPCPHTLQRRSHEGAVVSAAVFSSPSPPPDVSLCTGVCLASSSARQRSSRTCRWQWASRPKRRMRTKPFGSACSRKRRRNSHGASRIVRCRLPCR